MSTAHPGFAAVQSKIAKQSGVSQRAAGAILAASSRNASPAAKRKNPRLKKVTNPRRALAEQSVKNQAGPPGRKLLPAARLKGA